MKFKVNIIPQSHIFTFVFSYLETFVNSSTRKLYELKSPKSFSYLPPSSLIAEEYENTQPIQILQPTLREGTLTMIPENRPTNTTGRTDWFTKKASRMKSTKVENETPAPSAKGLKVNPCRRKSDCCYSHGGISGLELRTAHIAVDCPRKSEMDEINSINQPTTLRSISNVRSTRVTGNIVLSGPQ